MGVPSTYQDEPSPDFSYYRDDGEISDGGQCLGQIYIFSGRPMECRKAGLQTGFHNCCDADDDLVADLDNQLSLLKGTFAVVSKLKDAVSIASKAVDLYNTASRFADILNVPLTADLVNEVGLSMELSNNIITSVASTVEAGGSVTEAATQAVVNGLGITPQGIIASIAVNFALDWAMDILFSGCSEDDMLTAAYNELGLCHYIGTYCKKKIPLIGCVQKAKVFCCFNSKLARIIHEQGRPQLKDFGGENGALWGNTEEPNCRGFSPDEFRMLDFSKIDLSEWYGDIETRTQSEIQHNLQENIERFNQNLRPR